MGTQYAATYPFSMCTDEIGSDDGGNIVGPNGINSISVGWFGTDVDFAAITKTRYNTLGTSISEIDVYLNKSFPYVNKAAEGKLDVQSTFTHEIGHVYSLCDKYQVDSYGSWVVDWTMNGDLKHNDISARSLHTYDIKHLISVYS